MSAIRFENLDVFLKGGVSVDLADIQDKIVFRGRGGYCYEQAQLFGAVLERLGFGVERLLARVGPDGGPARPRTHLTLRVRADQNVWLADPGFGSSPPAPLSLRRYRSGGPQEVDGWIYEVTPDEEHGQEVWKLREYQDGQWVTLHRWDDGKVQPVDVVLSNHYTSTHPDSWFTWQPIIVKRDPGRDPVDPRPHLHGHPRRPREDPQRANRQGVRGRRSPASSRCRLTEDELDAVVKAPTGRDSNGP